MGLVTAQAERRDGRPMMFCQQRFVVKRIDMRKAASEEDDDQVLGFGRMVRRQRGEQASSLERGCPAECRVDACPAATPAADFKNERRPSAMLQASLQIRHSRVNPDREIHWRST